MRVNSTLQKLEAYGVVAVMVLLVSGVSFFLSSPFSQRDYGWTDVPATTSQASNSSSAPSHEFQPALLEPALRSLDGVAYHG